MYVRTYVRMNGLTMYLRMHTLHASAYVRTYVYIGQQTIAIYNTMSRHGLFGK